MLFLPVQRTSTCRGLYTEKIFHILKHHQNKTMRSEKVLCWSSKNRKINAWIQKTHTSFHLFNASIQNSNIHVVVYSPLFAFCLPIANHANIDTIVFHNTNRELPAYRFFFISFFFVKVREYNFYQVHIILHNIVIKYIKFYTMEDHIPRDFVSNHCLRSVCLVRN